MLDGLWIASASPAVVAALAALPTGPVAVIANPRLARALVARGRAVTEVAIDAALAPASFAAVVAVGAGDRADWAPTLAAWAAAVFDGGGLVLVDRAAATELSLVTSSSSTVRVPGPPAVSLRSCSAAAALRVARSRMPADTV